MVSKINIQDVVDSFIGRQVRSLITGQVGFCVSVNFNLIGTIELLLSETKDGKTKRFWVDVNLVTLTDDGTVLPSQPFLAYEESKKSTVQDSKEKDA